MYNVYPVSVRGNTEVGLPSGKKAVVTKGGEGLGGVKSEVKGGN